MVGERDEFNRSLEMINRKHYSLQNPNMLIIYARFKHTHSLYTSIIPLCQENGKGTAKMGFIMNLVKNLQQSQQFYSKSLPDRISHHYKLGVYREKLNH